MHRLTYALPAAAMAALLLNGSAAAEQRVGVNSAVNPDATGAMPGGAAKRLVIGEDVVFNEHIATGAGGQTQLLFVDESALSIGPNSDMTIDEFVYNPKTGTGTQALSATRGIFRYVGGKLSKQPSAVTVNTPSATIGIRGGVFILSLTAGGRLQVVFVYGNGLTVTGRDGTVVRITRPGFGVTIAGPGGSPSQPHQISGQALADFVASLDGRPGGHGGAVNIPSDQTVAGSGVSSSISNYSGGSQNRPPPPPAPALPGQDPNLQGQTQTTVVTQPEKPTPTPTPAPTPTPNPNAVPDTTGLSGGFNTTGSPATGYANQITRYSNGTVQNGVFITTLGSSTPLSFPLVQGTGVITASDTTSSPQGPVTGKTFVTPDNNFFYANLTPVNGGTPSQFVYGGHPVNAGAYAASGSPQFLAYAIQPDGALGSPIPFVRLDSGGALPNPTVSPLYVAVSPTTGFTADGSPGQTAFPKAVQASLAINGQGPNQSSVLFVAVGNAFNTTALPGQPSPLPVLNGTGEGSYRPSGSPTPTMLDTALLTGVDGTGNSFYGGNNHISGFVLTPNNCCGANGNQITGLATETDALSGQHIAYGFNQPAIATIFPSAALGTQSSGPLFGTFGGTMTPVIGGTAGAPYAVNGETFIDTDATNLQLHAAMVGGDLFTSETSGVSSVVLEYGSLNPGQTRARQGYVNDRIFAALEDPKGTALINDQPVDAQLYMVNANVLDPSGGTGGAASLLPPGAHFCQCQYLQWGYWGGRLGATTGTAGPNPPRDDFGHINTWVAGMPTPFTDLNNLITLQATGSYSGAAIGSVFNNGANYLAAGGFQQTYNFGTQSGTMAITNFDGRNFSGQVYGAQTNPSYVATLAGQGLSGVAGGLFYGPNAAETGGTFTVQTTGGAPYIASGIFAGSRTALQFPPPR